MWGCNPDCRLMIEESENRLEPTLTILEQAKLHQLERGINNEGFEPYYVSLGVTHSAIITSNYFDFYGFRKWRSFHWRV